MTLNWGPKGLAILSLFIVALLLSCGRPRGVATSRMTGLTQQQIEYQHVVYPFYIFVPSSYDPTHAVPAVLLIHGGGGQGTDMIAAWKSFAEQNGIILVAPTLPLGGNFETAVAPQLYPLIMDATRKEWNIDAQRIYLFGFSAGGYTVFDVSMFDSRYFAGGGVFAAVITPNYDWILQQATRRIPIAIYMGDHDEFFTVAQAQATRDLLAANRFTVRLKIFANLDHNYGAVADVVNADVWNFFGQNPPLQGRERR